jgi:hypothetical protein
VVEVGVTLPPDAVAAKPVPDHRYDVAAGVHFAVKTEAAPAAIAAGEAVRVHAGAAADEVTPHLTAPVESNNRSSPQDDSSAAPVAVHFTAPDVSIVTAPAQAAGAAPVVAKVSARTTPAVASRAASISPASSFIITLRILNFSPS